MTIWLKLLQGIFGFQIDIYSELKCFPFNILQLKYIGFFRRHLIYNSILAAWHLCPLQLNGAVTSSCLFRLFMSLNAGNRYVVLAWTYCIKRFCWCWLFRSSTSIHPCSDCRNGSIYISYARPSSFRQSEYGMWSFLVQIKFVSLNIYQKRRDSINQVK